MSLPIEAEAEEREGQTQEAEEESDSRRMKSDIVSQVDHWLPCTHHWFNATSYLETREQ